MVSPISVDLMLRRVSLRQELGANAGNYEKYRKLCAREMAKYKHNKHSNEYLLNQAEKNWAVGMSCILSQMQSQQFGGKLHQLKRRRFRKLTVLCNAIRASNDDRYAYVCDWLESASCMSLNREVKGAIRLYERILQDLILRSAPKLLSEGDDQYINTMQILIKDVQRIVRESTISDSFRRNRLIDLLNIILDCNESIDPSTYSEYCDIASIAALDTELLRKLVEFPPMDHKILVGAWKSILGFPDPRTADNREERRKLMKPLTITNINKLWNDKISVIKTRLEEKSMKNNVDKADWHTLAVFRVELWAIWMEILNFDVIKISLCSLLIKSFQKARLGCPLNGNTVVKQAKEVSSRIKTIMNLYDSYIDARDECDESTNRLNISSTDVYSIAGIDLLQTERLRRMKGCLDLIADAIEKQDELLIKSDGAFIIGMPSEIVDAMTVFLSPKDCSPSNTMNSNKSVDVASDARAMGGDEEEELLPPSKRQIFNRLINSLWG